MFSGNKSQIQTAESAVVRKTFLYFFSGGKWGRCFFCSYQKQENVNNFSARDWFFRWNGWQHGEAWHHGWTVLMKNCYWKVWKKLQQKNTFFGVYFQIMEVNTLSSDNSCICRNMTSMPTCNELHYLWILFLLNCSKILEVYKQLIYCLCISSRCSFSFLKYHKLLNVYWLAVY